MTAIQHQSKWSGIGHKRKMELKREERAKRRSRLNYSKYEKQMDKALLGLTKHGVKAGAPCELSQLEFEAITAFETRVYRSRNLVQPKE